MKQDNDSPRWGTWSFANARNVNAVPWEWPMRAIYVNYRVLLGEGDLFTVGLETDKGYEGGDIETAHLSEIPGPEFGVGGVETFMLWFKVSAIISKPDIVAAFTEEKGKGRFIVDAIRSR